MYIILGINSMTHSQRIIVIISYGIYVHNYFLTQSA